MRSTSGPSITTMSSTGRRSAATCVTCATGPPSLPVPPPVLPAACTSWNTQSACPWTLPIAPKTVAAAWAIAEYLIPHAQAAFSLMGADPVRAQAEDILGWLRRIESSEFSMRDCHHAFRRMTPAELLPSIDLLCEH